MRFYNQPHQYYCGGDLHARTLYLHVLDCAGGHPIREERFLAGCVSYSFQKQKSLGRRF